MLFTTLTVVAAMRLNRFELIVSPASNAPQPAFGARASRQPTLTPFRPSVKGICSPLMAAPTWESGSW
jgi:hypothetical protein